MALGGADQARAVLLRLDRQPRAPVTARATCPPEPAADQHFTTSATRPLGRILSVAAQEQLTGRIGGAVISYVLVPKGDSTRLLMKNVTARGRLLAPLLSIGDLVMARRQLLNLKQLAEQPKPPGSAESSPAPQTRAALGL